MRYQLFLLLPDLIIVANVEVFEIDQVILSRDLFSFNSLAESQSSLSETNQNVNACFCEPNNV